MSSIGSIMKGISEKFSGLVARIEKFNENDESSIRFSHAYNSNTMNDINSLTFSQTNCDPCGMSKAGHLQDRLASQEG